MTELLRYALRLCRQMDFARKLLCNKTRQGYVRKRILKPAGYFFAWQGSTKVMA